MSENLNIYRASAGSGKTFTLALEYIKLLIANPESYRKILAVTFTNKATGEMKERILGKLYGVANGLKSAADYTAKIRQQLPQYSEEQIQEKAGKALENILHDYGHFRIQTIDAFFQSVLRSLAKELDLNGDMEISLDGEELLENAVDAYIKKLEPETEQIAQVVRYIEDKMSSGAKWKIDREIKDFAKNILREEYQQRGEALREEMERDNGLLLKKFYSELSYRSCID
jgi:ATP-dependent exoDNAse (exonuclease V) beta subunit